MCPPAQVSLHDAMTASAFLHRAVMLTLRSDSCELEGIYTSVLAAPRAVTAWSGRSASDAQTAPSPGRRCVPNVAAAVEFIQLRPAR